LRDKKPKPTDQLENGIAFLLYDSKCGSCARFKKIVERLDFSHRMMPVSLQNEQARSLLPNFISDEEMMASFHIVYQAEANLNGLNGRIYNAGDALIQVIRMLPLGSVNYRLICRFKSIRNLVRWIYFHLAVLRSNSRCITQ